jgi:hemerythrin-like metal-binding protein
MPNTGIASATALAERIRESIGSEEFEGIGRVTASLGIAEWLTAESRDAWLERADRAMYQAKGKGRNRVESDLNRDNSQASTEHMEGTFLKLVWSANYGCGHPLIDAQHEHLFRLANALLDAVLSGRPIDEMNAFINTLMTAIAEHFQDEEKILSELEFAGLADHAKLHAALVEQALALKEAFLAGTLSVGSLLQFLAHDVVASHMLKADREFFHLMAAH